MQKDNALNSAIGKRIKEMRLKRNLSQDKLAEMIDVCNGAHISNIERGLYGISVPKLAAVCKALDVSADYLLFGFSPDNASEDFNKYINQLTAEQAVCLNDIIKAYVKSCGVLEERF